jgi:PII-like signaling protein
MGDFVMKGTLLRFYVHENRKHDHVLLYDWLLAEARKLGIQGGSAFRAIAGFGRHGVIHEEHFFELAGDLTVEIDFAVEADEAQRLLDRIRAERISIFYIRLPIEFGVVDGDA